MEGVGQQQHQLVPQVPAAAVGQLVAEDEHQLPGRELLLRQQQSGSEQSRRHGGLHGGADGQGRSLLQPHLPAHRLIDPGGLLPGGAAPAPGPAEKAPGSRQMVEQEQPRPRQPQGPQNGLQGQRLPGPSSPGPGGEGRSAGGQYGHGHAVLELEVHRDPGHIDHHRRLHRSPGQQRLPPHRGQQQHHRQGQPHAIAPVGAVPPVQQGLQQRQDQCRRPHGGAPLQRIQQQFHHESSNESRYRRSSSRSSGPMARRSYRAATMPVKLLP